MNPKQIFSYSLIHTDDKNKLREQMIDLSEQGFTLDQLSTCCVAEPYGLTGPTTAKVYFTAVMKKVPEAPIIDEGPDPTGGTPAASKVVPFRSLMARAA